MIAVTIGPGLFTGLRVGVVAAKTLAYVNKTPIAAVDTLEVVARQALDQTAHSTQRIKPVLNAQRQQLFGSTFQVNDQCQLKQLGESAIVDRQQWLDQLAPGDLVTGTGLKPLIETIRNSDSVPGIEIASESTWNSTAAQVGALGIEKFLAGHHDDLWKLEPTYFRPSAAEEKAKLKQNL